MGYVFGCMQRQETHSSYTDGNDVFLDVKRNLAQSAEPKARQIPGVNWSGWRRAVLFRDPGHDAIH